MASDMAPSRAAWNKPHPREGPQVRYKNEAGSNPVLRGYGLAVVSLLYDWGSSVVCDSG